LDAILGEQLENFDSLNGVLGGLTREHLQKKFKAFVNPKEEQLVVCICALDKVSFIECIFSFLEFV